MRSPGKRLLILTYYARIPGACQAEWIDDKIDSFRRLGCEIAVVSASCCGKYDQPIQNPRVPSLSLHDFRDEVVRARARGESISLGQVLVLPLVLTIGLVIDLCQHVVVRGVGDGRWSWALSAFPVAFFQCLTFRPDMIVTTGGPASPHLVGCVLGRILRTPVIVELQDPLTGADIGRNSRSAVWLARIEHFCVALAYKTIYVTHAAARFAQNLYPRHSTRIAGVYPGARDFGVPKKSTVEGARPYRIVHLGSLYATRNFRTICAAIDRLIADGAISSGELQLINLGHVGKEIAEEIRGKQYVSVLKPVGREDALAFAASCDLTVLIQNRDERSQVTIPYKTYDYLNLGTNLLGLLNSSELTELLISLGHRAVPVDHVEAIAAALADCLRGSKKGAAAGRRIDAVAQARSFLEIPAGSPP